MIILKFSILSETFSSNRVIQKGPLGCVELHFDYFHRQFMIDLKSSWQTLNILYAK